MKLKILNLLLIFLFISTSIFSQKTSWEKGREVTITLSNKEKIEGIIDGSDDQYLYLLSGDERLSIPIENIFYHAYKSVVSDRKSMEYREYADQYFVLPSAFPADKGSIYYRNINLAGNLFSFGVTDNFSLNLGFESLSIFFGEFPVIFATPKYSIPIQDNFRIAFGATGFLANDDQAAFTFSTLTFGSVQNNVSIGGGYGLSTGGVSEDPLFFGGFNVSFSKKMGLVGEVFVTDVIDSDFGYAFDLNLRFKFKNGGSFDIGGFTVEDLDGAIPTLSISLPIKN